MLSDRLPPVRVIDSHTGGEPTRLVWKGGPDLGGGSLAQRLQRFRRDHDAFRSAVVNEPRGSDVMVGALLTAPVDASCAAGVLFFNNVGYLGMCGHGTIGVIVSLAHLGRIKPGSHRLETPVGVVTATLHDNGEVSVDNVPSYRHAASVTVRVPGVGAVTGDVAWGGNWFFLVEGHGQVLHWNRVNELTAYAWQIRRALQSEGITGESGGEIDHVELFGPASRPEAHSRNFVLCPGGAYDRSPCGTGTSAKLACLAADGKWAEGEPWVQESILGSTFTGRYRREGNRILPTITGTAYVNSEASLVFHSEDPFCWGIGSHSVPETPPGAESS